MSDALPRIIQIALGHNNTAGLQAFSVEPHFQGMTFPRLIYTPLTVVQDGKPMARLRFVGLDAAQYQADMTRAGVFAAKVANVTVRLPDRNRVSFTNYNGQAVQPENADDQTWNVLRYDEVILVIRRLEALP